MISKNKAPLHMALNTADKSKSEAQYSEQHEARERWQWTTRSNSRWAGDEAYDNYSTKNRIQKVGRNIPHSSKTTVPALPLSTHRALYCAVEKGRLQKTVRQEGITRQPNDLLQAF